MQGVWTALVTPFTLKKDGKREVDMRAFRKLLQFQRKAGVAGVVICGTTGESPTLTLDEKKSLIETAVRDLKDSNVKVVAGTGSNDTAETVEFSCWASDLGVHGVLLVTPYYNKPSQAGLEQHFKAVADRVNCEVILYNVPSRTSLPMEVKTVLKLADYRHITTIKEATGNVAFTNEVIHRLKEEKHQMDVLSGDDVTFFSTAMLGAQGIISVASNLIPEEMVALHMAVKNKSYIEAARIHQKYYPLFRDLFVETNPAPIKWAMSYAGLCEADLRLPLVPLSKPNTEQLLQTLKTCGIKKGEQNG
jgi:4-hydroxy-tetrahydrodipicolinate synthase